MLFRALRHHFLSLMAIQISRIKNVFQQHSIMTFFLHFQCYLQSLQIVKSFVAQKSEPALCLCSLWSKHTNSNGNLSKIKNPKYCMPSCCHDLPDFELPIRQSHCDSGSHNVCLVLSFLHPS